jgi:hypothetical protein
VVANGKASDAEEQVKALASSGARCGREGATGDCLGVQDALDGRDAFSNAALWSFVGAGVLGAGTVVYALVASKAPHASGVRAAPLVTGRGGGIAIGGAF